MLRHEDTGKLVTVADLAAVYREALVASPLRVVRFPGIIALASELGVTHSHCWRVLVGERRSPRIERIAQQRGFIGNETASEASESQVRKIGCRVRDLGQAKQ